MSTVSQMKQMSIEVARNRILMPKFAKHLKSTGMTPESMIKMATLDQMIREVDKIAADKTDPLAAIDAIRKVNDFMKDELKGSSA